MRAREYDILRAKSSQIYQLLPGGNSGERKERKKKKKGQGLQHPCDHRRQKGPYRFLRRPEAKHYWPLSIEIRTCASFVHGRFVTHRHGGSLFAVGKEIVSGRETVGENFRFPLCNKCLVADAVCLYRAIFPADCPVKTYDIVS